MKERYTTSQKGAVVLSILVYAAIAVVVVSSLVGLLVTTFKASTNLVDREQSFQIAEAGIDYYRWHLAHAQSDYYDGHGATSTGPYMHVYYDKDGNAIGKFYLTITPPITGSTLVKVKSKGVLDIDTSAARSILVNLAIPSLAKYAVVANADMRFGEGTEIYGPIHSNGGIRFDGIAHNLVTSAKTSYDDPDHTGAIEFGVHTHVNPPPATGITDTFRSAEAPNNSVPVRTDVFQAGRVFPVPAADFAGITTDLAAMKTAAQSNGKYFSSSGVLGYHIVLKTNDTFDLYKVTSLFPVPNNCDDGGIGQANWGTWSIQNQTLLANYPNPTNGIIFLEDHVWVDGQINTARLTIAAGRFPDNVTSRRSITVNNNLTYTNYDGQDVISLIAQDNINVGMVSADTLRIDAALMAQNGRVGRYYYDPNANFPSSGGSAHCAPYHVRSSLTLYGMIGTALRYGFGYTDNTGYLTRNIIYDANLLYGPPPSFPLTSDQYSTVFWQEVPN
jgi:hypothetical protein